MMHPIQGESKLWSDQNQLQGLGAVPVQLQRNYLHKIIFFNKEIYIVPNLTTIVWIVIGLRLYTDQTKSKYEMI